MELPNLYKIIHFNHEMIYLHSIEFKIVVHLSIKVKKQNKTKNKQTNKKKTLLFNFNFLQFKFVS